MDVFLRSPIVGNGYDSFGAAVEPVFGRQRSAHNAMLSVAVGAGLIGLGLFAALLLIVLAGVLGTPTRRVEFLVVIATLIVGMTPANLENNKSTWFLLGWLAASRPLLLRPMFINAVHARVRTAQAGFDRIRQRRPSTATAPAPAKGHTGQRREA